MYGNTYNFETEYEQQVVVPIDEIQGTITNIKISFYQKADFYDKFNQPLPCTDTGYLVDENGMYIKDSGIYQIAEDANFLDPNIFVKDVYLCFGYDMSIFKNDMVEIYTQQSNTYKHSNDTEDNGVEQNRKTIKARWVHIDNGNPVDMVAAAKETEFSEVSYEIRWYRYKVGAQAADPYCGVYWERIQDASGFEYIFDPNTDNKIEKIKMIIIYNSITPYRSNELIFESEEDLPPSAEAQHIANALTITTDDNTNGNYMIYGQDNYIKGTGQDNETRFLSVWFDANGNGELEENEIISDEAQASNLRWIFPASYTMINLLNTNKTEIIENNEVIAYQVYTNKPYYTINSYYTPDDSNNTITCEYTLNGRVYTTEKEFTFGPSGTMGTDQTLVIDFVGDANAVDKSLDSNNNVFIEVQLYDNQNIKQTIPDGTVTWKWYYNSKQDTKGNEPILIEEKGNSTIILPKSLFDIEHLYIIQCTVGKLTTYFPIPIQAGGYSHIKGATQVIYQSDGTPRSSREIYTLYDSSKVAIEGVDWDMVIKNEIQTYRYVGIIASKEIFNSYDGELYTKTAEESSARSSSR